MTESTETHRDILEKMDDEDLQGLLGDLLAEQAHEFFDTGDFYDLFMEGYQAIPDRPIHVVILELEQWYKNRPVEKMVDDIIHRLGPVAVE